ncbi:Ig-like domain-containing protein [Pseudarthrobacter sulfonivorans]|uniref:Ig-like domain-containing protein n=1 Tax=Pseudarthrobacter sulfonivorans TaxID=121292 RepID=UPI000AF2DAF7|nr:Ig-like domain-containing protein [Pseudarthrobacter sulfonivorans]
MCAVALLTALSLVITLCAFIYEGHKTTDVELNDGGVWVTKPASLLVGHLNYQAQVLDSGLKSKSSEVELLQSGNTVLTHDRANATLNAVDPANVILGTDIKVSPSAVLALGGQTVAALDAATGKIFSTVADQLSSLTMDTGAEPLAELGANATITVGTDGTIRAASSENGQVMTIPVTGQGAFGAPSQETLQGITPESKLSVAAVGSQTVVFDSHTSTLFLPGGKSVKVDNAEGAVLQQSGPDNDSVVIATATGLVTQPLDGGQAVITDTGAKGSAIAPVHLRGCSYAAWNGSGKYVRDCRGESDDLLKDLEKTQTRSELVFRVNRDVVVLNDLSSGVVWLVNQNMVMANNWDDVKPLPDKDDEEQEEDSPTESLSNSLPKREDQNRVPVAQDDQLGVRPGRTIILSVLDNDNDPDGDLLTARVVGEGPKIGSVQPIYGGKALQIDVRDEASGTDGFRYKISDGRGGEAEASVSLTVTAAGSNKAPVQKRIPSLVLEQGGTGTMNVLGDWTDPDGDDLFLAAAATSGTGDLEFSADGVVTYKATGDVLGPQEMSIVVSDGQDSSDGTMRVDVRAVGTTKPIANPDHVTIIAGQAGTVTPLLNDVSPSGSPLRLAKVDESAGLTLTPDYSAGTFVVTAASPGTYYVQYLATDGPGSALGLVRVDVQEASAGSLPPIAVRDVALLPVGRDTLVDVLQNDSDPAGGILVVQSVSVPAQSGLNVAVLEHRVLRISDLSGIAGPTSIGYTVSNGALTAKGEVLVIPVPAPSKLQPPVAVDDTATVRAGDVVSIPVLDNDHHPNGDTISLDPDLIQPFIDPNDGDMFIAENSLKFRAGNTAKTVYATYEVVDSLGQKDSGYVTIRIVGPNAETNTPPRPLDATARVLAGSTVRIPISMNQIDPDGDSVELLGQVSAPVKGRIVEVGASWLVYEAFEDSAGTDTFTYSVRDRLGAEAQATVLVGISLPSASNQKPYPVKDVYTVRPGRQVVVPVLVNDTDPDGDVLSLVADGLDVPAGMQARVVSSRVLVDAPESPGIFTIRYRVQDTWGAEADGVLQVTVSADAKLEAPIARDDRVPAAEIAGKQSVTVQVLANDEDPDGVASQLRVGVKDASATVLADGVVEVQLQPTAQTVVYTVTDADGLTASAFVFVPGSDRSRPSLKLPIKPVEVKSGEPVTISLADYVNVGEGKTPRITVAESVKAAHSNGEPLVKDESHLVYTSVQDYAGADAVSFEVTDGNGPDDPTGTKAVLSLPITVLSPSNRPPTFVGGSVEVAPGESAQRVSLAAMSKDNDPGDLERLAFKVTGGVPAGVTAAVEGQELLVSAAKETSKGTSGTIQIEVTDGKSNPVTGIVEVKVTGSTRPLATATDDVLTDAQQGKPSSVAVLANDTNPFPDQALKLVSAMVETGTGTATVSGTEVVVTPGGDFVGTMVVRYRIADATGDPEREVDGRIRLTVKGKPDAPSTPSVASIQDRTVVLSWAPASNNGAEITGYTVKSAQGFSQACATTTCTLSGLTNDVEYTFTVTAKNSVGESQPSPASAPARPDARPTAPAAPTLKYGDKQIEVSWPTPASPGSAVSSYTVEISGAFAGASQRTATGNSVTWTGLDNGSSYQFRVQAHNKAPQPSEWGPYGGDPVNSVPAGIPGAPGTPTTERLSPVGSQAQLRVSWAAANPNGDPVSGYSLNVLRGGAVVQTVAVPAGQLSQAVSVDTSSTDYTFTVTARNKAGASNASAPSAPRRAFVPPGAPTNVVATAGDNQVSVTYTPGSANGANANEISYQFSVSGGAWRSDWVNNRITAGVPNNGQYSIAVRGVTTLDGERYEGSPSAPSNSVAPYGPIGQPGVTANGNSQTVTFNWSAPARNGRDIVSMEVNVDGGGWSGVGVGSGSREVGNGYSQTHSIQVRATDAAGQSSTNSASARSQDPPPKEAWISRGQNYTGNAYNVVVNTRNFPAGNYRYTCRADGSPGGWPNGTNMAPVYFPANGSVQLNCWTDYGGQGHEWIEVEIIGVMTTTRYQGQGAW